LPGVSDSWGKLQDAMNSGPLNPALDPAAAARDYAATTLFEQERLGVAPDERTIAPKSYVQNFAKAIAVAADSDDATKRTGLIGQVQREAQVWGENWPTVMRQMAPTEQPIVRAIAAGADTTAMTRLLSLPKDENPGKVLKDIEQSETKFKDLTTSLNTEMAPFLQSLVGRQRDRDFGAYYGLGEKLAALYVRDGDDASTAAHKAFNALIGNRYEFRDTWRMPKSVGVSADDVQAGVEDAKLAIAHASSGPQIATSLEDAKRDLNLTPQEVALYRRHVDNLTSRRRRQSGRQPLVALSGRARAQRELQHSHGVERQARGREMDRPIRSGSWTCRTRRRLQTSSARAGTNSPPMQRRSRRTSATTRCTATWSATPRDSSRAARPIHCGGCDRQSTTSALPTAAPTRFPSSPATASG
jgi:hypothetical protein